MTNSQKPEGGQSRRDFLKASAGAALASGLFASGVYAGGSDAIKVGLIGCGGRGSGALRNVLQSAPNVSVVALADAFPDALANGRNLANDLANDDTVKKLGNKADVPQDRCFVGLDAYQKLLDVPDVNYVILATPPGFRPYHLRAAVAAGKNIFTEKPVATDAPGIRVVLETYEKAKDKGLAIVAGTQRRHQLGYLESMKRIQGGEMGDIVAGRAYWNTGDIWFRPRKPGMNEVQYQVHNWYHFPWLCGDNICEQHVHNLDVMNWGIGAHPISAVGLGGRVHSLNDPAVEGVKFDHFAVEFEYPKEIRVQSMCRQIDGCENNVSEAFVGTKGFWYSGGYRLNGKGVITREQDKAAQDPYVQEHTDLIESIRSGKLLNELKQVAESTMTCILGRMTTYTGEKVTWDKAITSKEQLMPEKLTWDTPLPQWALAVPGKTRFV
ncbi:MAG TPA: Gfo/Idh/MocA family oxidoreductase [Gemmataceae bacterium]|nr:Gfo/Idh/MocA family oxidoreductase [Gemmataceae bacterium]